MATYMVEQDHGCGFFEAIIRCRRIRLRNSTCRSLPSTTHKKNSTPKTPNEKQGTSVPEGAKPRTDDTVDEKIVQKSTLCRRVSDAARDSNSTDTTTTSSSGSSTALALVKVNKIQERQSPLGEINRVSSGNILQLGRNSFSSKLNGHVNENSPRKIVPSNVSTMGNILRRNSEEVRDRKMDVEEIKFMGNEKYKQGKYEEALRLYDKAIAVDPKVAAYRSNKSAALAGLGHILDAVVECKEALTIDPLYRRAHHRLATLYFRLGFPKEALDHFSLSGSIASNSDYNQGKALETCLNKCYDFKERKDWTALLRQTCDVLALGVDSSLQVYALEAEALLNLHRHDQAYAAFRRGTSFDMDSYTRLFGQKISSFFYTVKAQVYTAVGRFEDAVLAAQNTAKFNPNDTVVQTILIKTRSISLARSKGNKLFKDSKFLDACKAYSEGLEYDPYNSVLLCNRAACRSKLGQFEKALEDSTLALNLQPSYSKARLRRAHCNAKLERWEASIQDYEILIREKPGDEEVGRALFEAKVEVKKRCGEDVKDIEFGTDVVCVSSIECFRHQITSPGMSVVLFCNKSNQQKTLPLLEHVRLRFPSINFLKVEVEDHPYLAKSEAVNYIPAFKIYKNGSRVRDIPGNNLELLENSVKLYSS